MSVSISQPLEEKGFGRDEYDRQPKGRDNSIVKMPESIQTGSRNVRAVVHMDFNLLVSFAVLSHHTLYLCLKWQKKNNISSYIFYIKIKVKFKFYFCVSIPGTQHTPLCYHQTVVTTTIPTCTGCSSCIYCISDSKIDHAREPVLSWKLS